MGRSRGRGGVDRMIAFTLINTFLLVLVTLLAIAAVRVRSLFAATMMLGIYSLLMACVWINMDAVDVAFTEAAVGAGISTILLVGSLVLVGPGERKGRTVARTARKVVEPPKRNRQGLAILVMIATGIMLVYGTWDMPRLGDPDSPANKARITKGYIAQDVQKEGQEPQEEAHGDYFHGHAPNMVTSVIVTYRAYDTMFELAVIFIAGMGTIILLRRRPRPNLRREA